MIDTKITKTGDVTFEVELSINMQHNLSLYVESIPGKPATYEDEHKKFYFTKSRLDVLVELALNYAKVMQADVFKDMCFEAAGMTYADMHRLMTGSPASVGIANKPYTADEDLVFLYGQLQVLYDFVYEVRCALD